MADLTRLTLSPEAFKNLDLNIKTDLATAEREIAKSRILESTLQSLKAQPGFNPAALSVVFGLKW